MSSALAQGGADGGIHARSTQAGGQNARPTIATELRRAWAVPLAGLLLTIGLTGCTASEVAQHGMAVRGPVEARVVFGADGAVSSVEGEYGGGTGSVLHIARKTWHESGTPASDFLATSDPTAVQATYFAGVREQSQQDAANFRAAIETLTSAAKDLAATAVQLRGGWYAAAPAAGEGAGSGLRQQLLDLLKDPEVRAALLAAGK